MSSRKRLGMPLYPRNSGRVIMEMKISHDSLQGFTSKQAIVKLVDGTSIKGWINMKQQTRLSDVLNTYDDEFLVMFNCSFREELGKVVFVNKKQILWVTPVDSKMAE